MGAFEAQVGWVLGMGIKDWVTCNHFNYIRTMLADGRHWGKEGCFGERKGVE